MSGVECLWWKGLSRRPGDLAIMAGIARTTAVRDSGQAEAPAPPRVPETPKGGRTG